MDATEPRPPMTVYKLIEVVGTSGTSVDDAIRGAIERASATVSDLQWFEVKEIRGRIDADHAPEFQVKVDMGFVVHAPADAKGSAAESRRPESSRQTRSQAAQLVAKKGGRRRSDLARGFEKQRSK